MSDETEFEQDIDTLVEMLRDDKRPTPEQLEAAGRVVRHTLVSVASIAGSLSRIAAAQERRSIPGIVVAGGGGAGSHFGFGGAGSGEAT